MSRSLRHSSPAACCGAGTSLGSIAYKTATFTLFDNCWPYAELNFAMRSSQSSISLSAFTAFVIFPDDSTMDIALMPDANVLGFKEDATLFHGNHEPGIGEPSRSPPPWSC